MVWKNNEMNKKCPSATYPIKIENLRPDNPESSEGVDREQDDEDNYDEAWQDVSDMMLSRIHLPPVYPVWTLVPDKPPVLRV